MATLRSHPIARTAAGAVFALAAASALLAGATAGAPAAEPATVVGMTNSLRFDPATVMIEAGGTVEWRNTSDLVHTVTADPAKASDPSHVSLPQGADTFDSGRLQSGDTFRHTFEIPGRYRYFCIPHEAAGMIGEIVVEPAAEAAPQPSPTAENAELRGEYVFHAAGCNSCHTVKEREGGFLAGGRAIESAFGTFFAPNITPHDETGIGEWTEEDFMRAITEGISPQGEYYYPSFPYPWYARMRRDDLSDLWAYLKSVPPVHNRVPEHDLPFPLDVRELILVWRLFEFEEGMAPRNPAAARAWNRGAYLANALAHCGACHTPSNAVGLYDRDRYLAGSTSVPGDFAAPNITPDESTGIGSWTEDDIVELLATGTRPDGSAVQGPMAEVVADTTSRLTPEDRQAIAVYLKSVPPIVNQVEPPDQTRGSGTAENANGTTSVGE